MRWLPRVLLATALALSACSGADDGRDPADGAAGGVTSGADHGEGNEGPAGIDASDLSVTYVDEGGNPFTYTRLRGSEGFRGEHDLALVPVDGRPVACQREPASSGGEGGGWRCIAYAEGSSMSFLGLTPGLVRPLITRPMPWSGEPSTATIAGRPVLCGAASSSAEALQAWSRWSGVGLDAGSTVQQCVDEPSGIVVRTLVTEPDDPTPPTVALEAVEITEPAPDSLTPPSPPVDATDLEVDDVLGADTSCCDGS